MNEDTIAVLIPLTAVFMSLLIPIVYAIVDYRRRRDLVEAHHKERMAAIERGMEIPPLPEAFYSPTRKGKGSRHLLIGMIWFFLGIALFVALGAVAGEDVRYFGLIPGGVGLAFLLYYLIEGRHEQRHPEPSAAPADTPVRRD